jgi:acetyl esterase/lipase
MVGERDDGEEAAISRRDLVGRAARLATAAPLLGALPMTASADTLEAGAFQTVPRVIGVPKTISPEAQQFLARLSAHMGTNAPTLPEPPPLTDKAAWKAYVAGTEKMLAPLTERNLARAKAKVAETRIADADVWVGTPDVMRHADRALIFIHGGAWTNGGGLGVKGFGAAMATDYGFTTFGVDYRMVPDFPYPAALDDCVAVYREVIKTYDPKKVAILGVSSGGTLCGSSILKIRDIGLPIPGAAVLLTPVVDLSQTSDTWSTNMGIDPIVTRHTYGQQALYTGGHDIKDPYLSPLFGDFTKGFPPTFLQSGTRDILLSDTVLMHQALLKAGIEAELHVWEAMPHAGFGGDTPEDREVQARCARFLDRHLA